jgi:hypothetical protein
MRAHGGQSEGARVTCDLEVDEDPAVRDGGGGRDEVGEVGWGACVVARELVAGVPKRSRGEYTCIFARRRTGSVIPLIFVLRRQGPLHKLPQTAMLLL